MLSQVDKFKNAVFMLVRTLKTKVFENDNTFNHVPHTVHIYISGYTAIFVPVITFIMLLKINVTSYNLHIVFLER